MHKVKEIMRLRFEKELSFHKIAQSASVSSSTVSEVLVRVKNTGLEWSVLLELDEEKLKAMLYPPVKRKHAEYGPEPDYKFMYYELRKKSVTLLLLWEEYIQEYPGGYRYSYFCELYQKWCKSLNISLRQSYKAGEKMFLDYAGQTVPVIDLDTGQERAAQIFVAVLGASNCTYAEGTWSQDLPSWIKSHTHALEYFCGTTEIWVPDNLRAGVSQSCPYEPGINPTYQDMARHYGAVVMPTRVRRPKDKAKAESAVLLVERWILARLRNKVFHGLAELNKEIRKLLLDLNNRPLQKLGVSRQQLYETLDKPALRPLPLNLYELALFKKTRVGADYHVELETNFYSAPYQLIHKEVYLRYTLSTVEILHKSKRVASHIRSYGTGEQITCPEHRPRSHREYLDWTPARALAWAADIGPMTARMAQEIFNTAAHPAQGLRSCQGLVSLERKHTAKRLEAACSRAVFYQTFYYKSVKSILQKGLDRVPTTEPLEEKPLTHANIRGANYYPGGNSYVN